MDGSFARTAASRLLNQAWERGQLVEAAARQGHLLHSKVGRPAGEPRASSALFPCSIKDAKRSYTRAKGGLRSLDIGTYRRDATSMITSARLLAGFASHYDFLVSIELPSHVQSSGIVSPCCIPLSPP